MGKSKESKPTAAVEQRPSYHLSVRLGDLVDSVEAINALTDQKPNGQTPSAVFGMTIARLMTEMQPHMKNYNQVVQELRAKYLTPVKKGEDPKDPKTEKELTPENRVKFDAELQEVLDMEVPLNLGMIPLSAIVKEDLRLSGAHLYALRWVIKWDVEPLFVAPEEAGAPPSTEPDGA